MRWSRTTRTGRGRRRRTLRSYLLAHYRYAVIHVQDTDYGFRLIGIRPTDAGHRHLRITSHVFPVCSMIASPGLASGSFFIVPVDDENCMRFFVRGNPDRPFTAAEREAAFTENTIMDPADPRRRLKRADNDYMIDRAAQKTTLISGILPNAEQDYAVTESMGPIMDRTSEHLYSADGAIIRLRQLMVRAAKGIDEGVGLPALDPDDPLPPHPLGGGHRSRGRRPVARGRGRGGDGDAGRAAVVGGRVYPFPFHGEGRDGGAPAKLRRITSNTLSTSRRTSLFQKRRTRYPFV